MLISSPPAHWVSVVIDLPAHSRIAQSVLHYRHTHALPAGTLVRVPLGNRTVLGVVWDDAPLPDIDLNSIKPVHEVLDCIPPLNAQWRQLVKFCAQYYQRSLGEVALAALPPALKNFTLEQLQKRVAKKPKTHPPPTELAAPIPTEQQQAVLATLATDQPPRPALLFGTTGSGKTEVYMRLAQQCLDADPQAQVLILVPEINLTPQLQARFEQRFPTTPFAILHSRTTPAQRMQHWLAAHHGTARIVLGTRMAVWASMPHLQLIVVDEEHDPSYKQQEGARYSARDLAIYRAHQAGIRVLLGSATPSLESWYHSRPKSADDAGGRYLRLSMPHRAGNAPLPSVHMVDMANQPYDTLISKPLQQALHDCLARGEQAILLLNRRGYAPVLHCRQCDWKSECPQCSAYRVFHKADRTLRCHHCGLTERIPHACPNCGNIDIRPVGQGTEQLEEACVQQLHTLRLPHGKPPVVARMDADTTRHVGSLEQQLEHMHSGAIDVLVGTQMIAKGHDFRRVTLVAALNPDGALFSSDFRAPERLFSLLMQVAGRAGRDASIRTRGALWVQTRFADHPLFKALQAHDYAGFATAQLQERAEAAMPPFSHQALVRAEGKDQALVQGFLNQAAQSAQTSFGQDSVFCYPAIPSIPQRVAQKERAQMLVECANRADIQRFLRHLHHYLQHLPHTGVSRWAVDVDPLHV